MQGVTAVPSQGCCQRFFNSVQNRFYAFQQSLCNCCSTDTKIYALLIVGRMLQAAALVSFAATIIYSLVLGPIALVAGLVAVVAFGVIGTYIAGNPQELHGIIQMARPFVPGQPIGLRNMGNNCWMNSGLQLLAHTPAFEPRLRQIPLFSQFLDDYRAARDGCHKIASHIDSHQIRQFLSQETGGLISAGAFQEDASQIFEFLFQSPHSLFNFEHQLDGAPSTPRAEPMIQVDIPRESAIPDFQQLLHNFFDHRTDLGQRQELFFPRPPDDLLIQFKRFYQDQSGALGKISDPIEIPPAFQLQGHFSRSGEAANYECDAFLLHNGLTQHGGHYIAYLKIGGTWWCCNDALVYEISANDALNFMKQSYISHYRKL